MFNEQHAREVQEMMDKLEPGEALALHRKHDATATMYLFVHCGRTMYSGSRMRFCRMCGAEIYGDPYNPKPGEPFYDD